MEHTYFSSFPEGLKVTILQIASEGKIYSEIVAIGDNYIIYKSTKTQNEIRELYYFEVSFVIIKYFPNDFCLDSQIKWIYKNLKYFMSSIIDIIGKSSKSLRIVESKKGGNVINYANKIKDIEFRISKNINIDRGHPDIELRIIEREEYGLIGIRISKPPEYVDDFQKNSVRKEIAYIMNYLSEPSDLDIFLDPFCGAGMIPIMRSKMASYDKIIVSDIDTSNINQKISKLKYKFVNLTIIESSIQKLHTKLKINVNKIVTDPPWGLIQNVPDIKDFYSIIFNKLIKITYSGSIIVLLTVYEDYIKQIVNNNHKILFIDQKLNVKVSGHNSVILKIKKY